MMIDYQLHEKVSIALPDHNEFLYSFEFDPISTDVFDLVYRHDVAFVYSYKPFGKQCRLVVLDAIQREDWFGFIEKVDFDVVLVSFQQKDVCELDFDIGVFRFDKNVITSLVRYRGREWASTDCVGS